MNREELIKAQNNDDSLTQLRGVAIKKDKVAKSTCFYYDHLLLMRFYRSAKLSVLDTQGKKRQAVLPTSAISYILELARDGQVDIWVFIKHFIRSMINFIGLK